MSSVIARLRSLWRGMRRGSRLRDEMSDEFRLHLELRTSELIREGLDPQRAATRARIEFGDLEQFAEQGRRSRGLAWFDGLGVSLLDLRLGARMLMKYPGLTIAGGFGIAVAVAIGAGVFDTSAALFYGKLPVPEGDRVIAIDSWDVVANQSEPRALHQFVGWRNHLASVEQLSAYRETSRNLIVPNGSPETIVVAEMTASGFDVARVPALIGRHLLREDERVGATPVVVIGYDVWQTRFKGDAGVIGQALRIGDAVHSIVGVMPDGFAFPINDHYWIPLHVDGSGYPERAGPAIGIFGRLVPGASIARAQAELETIAARDVAGRISPADALRPRVRGYTQGANGIASGSSVEIQLLRFAVSLILVVVCLNVAMLVYARTATRHGEIAVRTALGASRKRIVSQLFAEALVLSALASAAGLVIARVGIRQICTAMPPDIAARLPYWLTFDMSPATIAYVAALTLGAAVIAGVVPALQATGRHLQDRLRTMSGGSSRPLGKTWNTLVVVQVAFAMTLLPSTAYGVYYWTTHATAAPGFAADRFLSATLALDAEPTSQDSAAFLARYAARQRELSERLLSSGAVSTVTFSSDLPGREPTTSIEIDAKPRDGAATYNVGVGNVDTRFFPTFGVPLLAGRAFTAADLAPGANAIIINETFARRIFGDASPLGRRIRDAGAQQTAWYEIVGVAQDFPRPLDDDAARARLYHPLAIGATYPLSMYAQPVGASPAVFAQRFREAAVAIDPTLRPADVQSLDTAMRAEQRSLLMVAIAFAVVALAVVLLSAAGIYALMSFTVTQRRREVGIRIALGAQRGGLLFAVFRRAALQLLVGVGMGAAIAGAIDLAQGGEMLGGHAPLLLTLVALAMIGVGLCAAIGPALRGLRIEPTEALKSEV